ncbi:hypothetical protein Bca4012_099501 [Brassica carinata]|uniref:Splicing factor SF3a60 /Prp9 subunit C-terminal domain-containing protein n=3 Tax=Brassica TaxID=3705 RepID=A0A8X7TTV5_BRACI|nr:hypothetical protein Bca52824_082097 [Brassica carinata]CAF2058505.1 unnamed protein product [Brassica napus]CDY07585.1 BnaC06g14790D [Brassica napus]
MMSSSVLEQTRSRHEEIERLERLIVEELRKTTEPASGMERLVKGHRVRNMVQSIMLKTKKLVETYEDKDRTMETEIAMLGETDLFYDRLEEIREYHRKLHLSGHLVDDDDDDASEDYIALVTKEVPVIAFSEEEGFEKKQGLTFKEMEEERERDQNACAKLRVYHPHWLKNLRELQHEFKCEICGNRRYKGRRGFKMHFKEAQHQRGMRLLGIPSTNSLKEITTIDEAEELWRRIKRQGMCIWRPELEE